MQKSFLKFTFLSLFICSTAGAAFATDATKIGQNAFTRAVQGPLSDIVTPVENPHLTPCNSVVECRKYGSDLKTVWQLNNGADTSPKEYPDNCYVIGKNGKYFYSAAACSRNKK